MKKNKKKSLNNSILRNTSVGLLAGIITFVMCLSISSVVILKSNMQSSIYYIFMLISIGISGFIASLISSGAARKTRFLNGLLTVLLLSTAEFILLFFFNSSSLSFKIYFLIPVNVITGVVGSITGSNIQKK